MRRRDVRPQRLRALPGFENNETVRPIIRLERADRRGVDVTGIFDAPLFGVHIGDVGAKGGQKFVTAAWIGGDDGDDADHLYSRLLVRLPGQRGQLTSPAPHSPAKRRGAKSRSCQRSRPASADASLALGFITPAWFNAVRGAIGPIASGPGSSWPE